MASFKKFKIGNTSYDVKDANAGYSIDTNGAAIFLKNSDGTIISSISAPSGMDYDIIADEFDTTPIATGYSKYDLVSYKPQWTINWYVSLIDNNTDTPGTGNNWVLATLNTAMLPQWMTQYMYIADPGLGGGKYWFNEGEGHQVTDPNHDSDMHVITDKGAWTNQGGGSPSYHQYSVGDYVIYNNDLYRCTGATTGQSWDSTKWTQVQIMDEIPSVPSNIVSSVSVNPIYTSGTPIAQISVTDSNGTTGTTIVAPSGSSALLLQIHCSGTDTLASVLGTASTSGQPQTKSLATIINYSDYLSAINSGKTIRVIDDVNSNGSFDIIYNNSFANPIGAFGIFPMSNNPRTIGVEFTINSSNKITALTFTII